MDQSVLTLPKVAFQNYRFDFTDDMQNELLNFAKIHRYDDRHTFKDAWTTWISGKEIAELIALETEHLETSGFKGDALDKMFKSVRYYYRKKLNKQGLVPDPDLEENDEDKDLDQEKIYTGFSSSFLKIIDDDVLKQINANINSRSTEDLDQDPQITKPSKKVLLKLPQSKAYQAFCQNHKPEIYEELVSMREKYGTIPDNISAKMKKTYKNRFYNVRQKMITFDKK